MLTPAETKTLVEQLRFIFQQFVNTDQHAIVHAVLRMSVEAVEAVLELSDSLIDAGDDASCGPSDQSASHSTGSDVRCPHCHKIF